jgi:hypothetical protein
LFFVDDRLDCLDQIARKVADAGFEECRNVLVYCLLRWRAGSSPASSL